VSNTKKVTIAIVIALFFAPALYMLWANMLSGATFTADSTSAAVMLFFIGIVALFLIMAEMD
jgi:RsiW-degrading membrane proteinase PrsW (M82 family)